jgi:hypothetical protein
VPSSGLHAQRSAVRLSCLPEKAFSKRLVRSPEGFRREVHEGGHSALTGAAAENRSPRGEPGR